VFVKEVVSIFSTLTARAMVLFGLADRGPRKTSTESNFLSLLLTRNFTRPRWFTINIIGTGKTSDYWTSSLVLEVSVIVPLQRQCYFMIAELLAIFFVFWRFRSTSSGFVDQMGVQRENCEWRCRTWTVRWSTKKFHHEFLKLGSVANWKVISFAIKNIVINND
jgi:hypothetical protein